MNATRIFSPVMKVGKTEIRTLANNAIRFTVFFPFGLFKIFIKYMYT